MARQALERKRRTEVSEPDDDAGDITADLARLPDDAAAALGRSFLRAYLQGGFQSLSKRDLDLLVFVELERAGLVPVRASNYDVARRLRVTPQRAATLRRDAHARWRTEGWTRDNLRATVFALLDPDRIEAALRSLREDERKARLLPLHVEHPAERAALEEAIKRAGWVPRYQRNREVLLVPAEALVSLAIELDLGDPPPQLFKRLKRELAQDVELSAILTGDVRRLSATDIRAALNKVGAAVVGKLLEEGALGALGSLRKVLFGG